MLFSTQFVDFMRSVDSCMSFNELLALLQEPHNHCIFIKDFKSCYCYANQNYVHLMGLHKLNQLVQLNDYDLSKNKTDADKYVLLDQWILDTRTKLSVSEPISPSLNQPLAKIMKGTLYPLWSYNKKSDYVLGIVSPDSKLLKLDFDILFKLSGQQLKTLLVKPRYLIKISSGSFTLSKMEICTLVELLKGNHAGEIAQVLGLKQTTIESYLINIKNKLAVNSKSELIQLTLREEILQQVII